MNEVHSQPEQMIMMAWPNKNIAESVARRESCELAKLLISKVLKEIPAGANIIIG